MTPATHLLPRPPHPRRPVPPVIRWRPSEVPPVPGLEQLAAIAWELALGPLV